MSALGSILLHCFAERDRCVQLRKPNGTGAGMFAQQYCVELCVFQRSATVLALLRMLSIVRVFARNMVYFMPYKEAQRALSSATTTARDLKVSPRRNKKDNIVHCPCSVTRKGHFSSPDYCVRPQCISSTYVLTEHTLIHFLFLRVSKTYS